MIVVSSDSISRTELVREVVRDLTPGACCTWCGSKRWRYFKYGTRRDGISAMRTEWHKGQFCNKSCHDSYYD